MTVNTIEPAPANETSMNGRLRLELGDSSAGAGVSQAFTSSPNAEYRRPIHGQRRSNR
jgi:hypothetical protein